MSSSSLLTAVKDFVERRCAYDCKAITPTSEIKDVLVADFGSKYTDEEIHEMWSAGKKAGNGDDRLYSWEEMMDRITEFKSVRKELRDEFIKLGGQFCWNTLKGDCWNGIVVKKERSGSSREVKNLKDELHRTRKEMEMMSAMLAEIYYAPGMPGYAKSEAMFESNRNPHTCVLPTADVTFSPS